MNALLGQAMGILGWEKGTLVEIWFMLVGCLAILPFIRLHALLPPKSLRLLTNSYAIGGALLQTLGVVVLNVGFDDTRATAIETTLSACYPILTVLLALIFFKEQIDRFAKVGIVATILGVAIISYH